MGRRGASERPRIMLVRWPRAQPRRIRRLPPLPPLGSGRSDEWPAPPPPRGPGPEAWSARLTDLPGVGRTTAERARALGILTVGDLLEQLPARYEDFDEGARPVAGLVAGEEATVRVALDAIAVQRTRRRNLRIVRARVHDDTGRMAALWFNQQHLARILHPGDELLLRGRLSEGGRREMAVRSHEVLGRPRRPRGSTRRGWCRSTRPRSRCPPRRIRELVDLARPLARAAPERLPAWIRRAPVDRRRRRRARGGALPALARRGAPRPPPPGPGGADRAPARAAGRAPARGSDAGGAAPAGDGGAVGRAPGVAALRPDGRAAPGGPRDRPRPGAPAPDAATAAGRGRVRQDRRRGPRHLPGGRGRRAGGPAGAHGDARRAAPEDARRAAGPGGAGAAPAHRARPARRARAAADGALHRHGRGCRRHAGAALRGRGLRPPGARRR